MIKSLISHPLIVQYFASFLYSIGLFSASHTSSINACKTRHAFIFHMHISNFFLCIIYALLYGWNSLFQPVCMHALTWKIILLNNNSMLSFFHKFARNMLIENLKHIFYYYNFPHEGMQICENTIFRESCSTKIDNCKIIECYVNNGHYAINKIFKCEIKWNLHWFITPKNALQISVL